MYAYFAIAIIVIAIGAVMAGVFFSARKSERLKYEFITIIAHKFRTPLTHIKWATDAMIESETEPYKKQSIMDIKGSNERLIKLVGTLIELTDSANETNSSYKLEQVDLCGFVRAAVEEAKQTFHEKNLFIGVTCTTEDIAVKADRSRLEFVMDTLLTNACTYTPPGRNVTVIVSADQKRAAISVKDDGIGIDPREMPRVFSKFFRAKNAQDMDTEGFGVGLFLAKAVVNRHHGKLQAYSDGVGRGATFSVILPRVK